MNLIVHLYTLYLHYTFIQGPAWCYHWSIIFFCEKKKKMKFSWSKMIVFYIFNFHYVNGARILIDCFNSWEKILKKTLLVLLMVFFFINKCGLSWWIRSSNTVALFFDFYFFYHSVTISFAQKFVQQLTIQRSVLLRLLIQSV